MKSLNKVQLIGNLTRDPELKYTPQGTAVCTFGVATNRQWTTESGEKKDEADFHKIVSWNKLAEICANLLKKGRKVYVEGRLQTRNWQGTDGTQRTTTEIVINDMIILDKKEDGMGTGEIDIPEQVAPEVESQEVTEEKPAPKKKGKGKAAPEPEPSEDDIPF